jgi:ribosomal protein S18 acetylase RimI-like enzyme
MLIRPATSRDLPRIVELMALLEYNNAPPVSLAKAKKIFATMKRYPNYRFYVAVQDRKIVGTYALLIMHTMADQGRPSAIVEDVAVDANLQGKGIGRAMMQHALRLAAKNNAFKLVLSSNNRRTLAHKFYKGLGFESVGTSFGVFLTRGRMKR